MLIKGQKKLAREVLEKVCDTINFSRYFKKIQNINIFNS